MRAVILWLLPVIFFVGCAGPHYGDFFPYYDDGTPKPKVVFLPLTSSSAEDRPLAQYFDASLRWAAMDRGALFLYSTEEIQSVVDRNVNEKDILKKANCFHPADFVIEAEVVEDIITPYSSDLNNCFTPLLPTSYKIARVVKLCIRVIDIRNDPPKTILYEVLDQSQAIVRDERLDNASSIYERLVDQAICRLEEVIWSAR